MPSPNGIQEPLSVAQYHELIRAGILTEDAPVELLEGRLVTKMPKDPPHRLATGLLREALQKVVPEGWYVDSQEPVTLSDGEPEPDVMVVRGTGAITGTVIPNRRIWPWSSKFQTQPWQETGRRRNAAMRSRA